MPEKEPPQSAKARNNAQREKILEANPLEFLLKAMHGEGAPVRDLAGRVVSQDEPLDYDARVGIAQKLLDKVLPSLTAQKLEVSGDVENTFRLVLSNGMAPPGSDAKLVEHQTPVQAPLVAATDQAGSDDALLDPVPAEPEPAEKTQKAVTAPQEADGTRAARRRRRWKTEDPA